MTSMQRHRQQAKRRMPDAMTRTVCAVVLFAGLFAPVARAEETSITFALVPKQVNNSFFDLADEGCKLAASKLPDVSCLYVGPADEGDAQAQADIIDDLIAGVYGPISGMSVSVSDETVTGAAIDRAVNAGIPVVTFDSDAKESERTAYVGTNNMDFGQEMGKLLVQLDPVGGNYGIISSFAPNVVIKAEGVRTRLEDSKWIEDPTSPKDCLGDIDLFYQQLEEFAADPNIGAILPTGGWGFLTEDTSRWTRIKDKYPNVTIVASETFGIALDLMSRGYVDGLVGQLPFNMGELSIEALWDLHRGIQIDEYIWGTAFTEVLLFPLELPDPNINYNYIDNLAILGYVMFGLIAASSLGLGAWTYAKRSKRIVRASQPMFLGMICVGVLIMASTLIPLTVDDQYYSQQATNIACMSLPWCVSIGFTTTFAALFSKTWRVNQIFHNPSRFTRMKVTSMDVIWPFAVLMTANVIALICWTTIDPLVFTRSYHAGTDDWNRRISSFGTCTSSGNSKGGMWPYLAIIIAVNMGALVLANVQSYQARSIRTEFSESKFISIIMASMLQALVISIPILVLVYDQPRAMFVILVCLVSVICSAVLVLMFLPKIQYMKEWELEQERKRVSKALRLANGGTDSSLETPSSVAGAGGAQGLKVQMSYSRPLGPSISSADNEHVGKSGLKVQKFSSRQFFRDTTTGNGGDTGNGNEEREEEEDEDPGLEVHKIETHPMNSDSENLLNKIEECDKEPQERPE